MDTPLGEGTKRAIITAFITFVYTAFLTYQGIIKAASASGMLVPTNDAIRDSIVAGVIVALAPFVVQAAQGGLDQRRADRGEVIPADVPIAIAAKESGRKPSAIARDFAPADLNKKAA